MKSFKSVSSGILVAIVGVLLISGLVLLPAFVIMLLLGAVHTFVPWIPLFSFWQTFLVVWLINAVSSIFKPTVITV